MGHVLYVYFGILFGLAGKGEWELRSFPFSKIPHGKKGQNEVLSR